MSLDIRTLLLCLVIGNAVFGATLVLFQFRQDPLRRNHDWTRAKFLQALGWLFLCFRGSAPDLLSFMVGNIVLLSGVVFECWAIFFISERTVWRGARWGALVGVVGVVGGATLLGPAGRISLASCVAASFFGLAAWALLTGRRAASLVRLHLAGSLGLVATLIMMRALVALCCPEGFVLYSPNWIQQMTFVCVYYLMLTSGFGMLLLTREAADLEKKRQHELLAQQKQDLEAILARTRRLEGIISICMYCKRIHNEEASWQQLESYITENSDALFSHGICPDCYGRVCPQRGP